MNSISHITIIVPVLNETKNLEKLISNLQSQKIPKGVAVDLIISDNGSNDYTKQIYEKLISDSRFNVFGSKMTVIFESQKGSVGSARRSGILHAINKLNDLVTPDQHILISLDADSQFVSSTSLLDLVEIYKDRQIMLAHGPILLKSSSNRVSNIYALIQKPYNYILLKRLFKSRKRNMKDYINPPYDIFHGIFTTFRASLLIGKNSDRSIAFNYRDEDTTGDDLRFSLEVQRILKSNQIIFSKKLSVYTSIRGYESKKGHFSVIRSLWKSLSVLIGLNHTPYSISNKNFDNKRKVTFGSVVESFIKEVDG